MWEIITRQHKNVIVSHFCELYSAVTIEFGVLM